MFFSWGGETVLKISDFPDTQAFQTPEGDFVDAGAIYKQITIFFLPLWNYDVHWTGYINSETYIELSRADLEELAHLAQISLPQDLVLPFWDRYGGKLVLSLLLLVVLLYTILSDAEQPIDNNV